MGFSRLRGLIIAATLVGMVCQPFAGALGSSRIEVRDDPPLRSAGALDFAIIIPPFIQMRQGVDKPLLETSRYREISSITLTDEATSFASRQAIGNTRSITVTSNAGALLFTPAVARRAAPLPLSPRTLPDQTQDRVYIFAMP